MAAQAERTTVTWSTPECPFSIQCSTRVLDDIRLTATDAFFSLPRGGAEIGGILLGSWQDGRLTVSGSAALECEHALGPSFTLSVADESRLQSLIGAAIGASGLRPVGWYHSHTRSGVLLTDSDLTIHNRYFPEPWQVALVVKPHTLEPMRAGFFFRGPGGIIHSSASYHEFLIEPLPVRQVPRPAGMEPQADGAYRPAAAGPIVDVRAEPAARPIAAAAVVDVQAEHIPSLRPAPPVVAVEAAPAAPVAAAASASLERRAAERTPPPAPAGPALVQTASAAHRPEDVSPPLPIPRSLQEQPKRSWRWLKALAMVVVAAGLGAALYLERDAWYPTAVSLFHKTPAAAAPNPAFGLNTVDQAGQLQIRWDAGSPAVRSASGASLEIVDGGPPPSLVALDAQHLASGVFTYARRNARVDVTLVLDQPGGGRARQVTTFLGQAPPEPPAPPVPAQPNPDREEMRQVVSGLRQQLDAELEHSRKLEKLLNAARAQLRDQQQRRLGNQARRPEP